MKLNWNSVRAEHIVAACEWVATQKRKDPRGLCIDHQGAALSAKDVQRAAYLLANGLDQSTQLKFTSGDSTIKFFHKLGFTAYRKAPAAQSPTQSV